jgi:perosamine synthetase
VGSIDVAALVGAVLDVTGGPAGHHDAVVMHDDRVAVGDYLHEPTSYRPINELEMALQRECGVRHAIAVSNGSAALELALHAVGVRSGDAVVVPALSFVAAANAVTRLGAVPVFVDAQHPDFGLNVHKLGRILDDDVVRSAMDMPRRTIAAIVAVHVLGHPCDIADIVRIGNHFGVPVIEDAAAALGSSADGGRSCGSFGKVGIISFNHNKIVTGTGGAVLTNDAEIAGLVRHLSTTARVKHPWLVGHDAVAWNYRMPTVCAALVGSQVARLDRIVLAKRALAAVYQAAFDGMDGVKFHVEPAGTRSNYWLNTILVPPRKRDAVLTALHERGLIARALFTPMHQLAPYADNGGKYPAADDIWSRAVCLPSGIAIAERFT